MSNGKNMNGQYMNKPLDESFTLPTSNQKKNTELLKLLILQDGGQKL